MIDAGVIDDYTFLWYDVRPHPNFGTVEIRAMDAQTRVEHTLALAALIQAMVKELSEHYEAGKQLAELPVRDARREQVARRPARDRRRARRPPELRPRAARRSSRGACTTGCASTRRTSDRPPSSRAIEDMLENGNGAARQRVVYEANHDSRRSCERSSGQAD